MIDRDSPIYSLFRCVFDIPFSFLPNGRTKDKLRAFLFSYFSTPYLTDWLKLPRQELLIEKGDAVVMIGTSSASRVHLLADLVGPSGEVYIFEPSSINYLKVKRAAMEYDFIVVDDRGAWNEQGEKRMALSSLTNGGHRVTEEATELPHDMYNEEQVIQVDTLDNLLGEYSVSPDYLEVATAGTELQVLQGATETLSNEMRLFVKSWGVAAHDIQDSKHDIESMLTRKGFNITTSRIREKQGTTGIPDGDIFAWK